VAFRHVHFGERNAKICNFGLCESMKTPPVSSDAGGVFMLLRCFNSTDKRLKRFVLFFLTLEPPDLSIEMPNLNITAVRKLTRGPQGLRICFGIDRLVRSDAIISIY